MTGVSRLYCPWLLLGLLFTGCAKCGRAPAPKAFAPLQQTQAVDLRTALFTVFPEFRGAEITNGRAWVERTMRLAKASGAPVEDLFAPHAMKKGFLKADGGPGFVRPPFELDVEAAGPETYRLEVGLPLGQSDVGRLLQSPSPMTSEELAHWLPFPPGAEVLEETFFLELTYLGKTVARTDYLVRQVVGLLLASHWSAAHMPPGWPLDGGEGSVPAELELRLERSYGGTKVELKKKEALVTVRFLQPLTVKSL